jgi:phosphoribosylaminoimidazolecarboxamide formyltransferase/IMP cyclohydrolase
MPRALLSVSDKTGLLPFARALADRGFDLVSTGGTAAALEQGGLAVTPVSQVTAFPEMMDGRVKTLHPMIHGGILARRSRLDHMEAASIHGITPIDVVVVNLYPFERAAGNPASTVEELIEQIDIGGPALVRAAAKNFEDVLVVVEPADYDPVIGQLDRSGGPDPAFRLMLARKAFGHTASYDGAIATALGEVATEPGGYARTPATAVPDTLRLSLPKVRDLRYGENSHQRAAWYADGSIGFGAARTWQGDELSFTNLLDLDAALRIVVEFSGPAAAVIKHTNPCGVARGATQAEAYVRARDADRLSAFGGIVALNRRLDEQTARAIVTTKIDAVVAPDVDADAHTVLASKPRMRVVTAPYPLGAQQRSGRDLRSIVGAVLVQDRDRVEEAASPWPSPDVRVVSRRAPTDEEWRALRFAWRICAHVKSNTVIFTTGDRTLAIGAGQMSRVDAVMVARMKADAVEPGRLRGSVAASDAFFPFRDGLDAVAAAGATAAIAPGGSLKDDEVIAAADEHGLALVFTARRHFRH